MTLALLKLAKIVPAKKINQINNKQINKIKIQILKINNFNHSDFEFDGIIESEAY
jgi:hypothetical protein